MVHETSGRVIEVSGLRSRTTIRFERPTAEVSGRVLSRDGHVPLGNVFVYLSGTSHADTTDIDGAFRLGDVPPGTYDLAWDHPVLRPDGTAALTRIAVGPGRDTTVALHAPQPAAALLGCDEPGGVVLGAVEEPSTGTPLNGVLVRLVDGEGRARETRSGAGGRFKFCDVAPGVHTLSSRLLDRVGPDVTADLVPDGVARVTVPIPLAAAGETSMEPISLDPLTVTVRRPDDRLAEFRHRMERGFGSYILREDLERRMPARLSDVLAEHGMPPGQGSGLRAVRLENRRYGCAPMVYIDGHRVTSGVSPASTAAMEEAGEAVNLVHPADIEAVEIYRGPASVPGEFGGSTARCGVIVIWTRLVR